MTRGADAFLACVEPLLNHVLRQNPVCRQRLLPFVGQVARLSMVDEDRQGGWHLDLQVKEDGSFSVLETLAERDGIRPTSVVLALPTSAVWQGLTNDRQALFANAQIEGSAQLAEALAFIFRNMHWDVEDDLARITGEIVARRLHQGAKVLWKVHLQAVANLGENSAEYLADEQALLLRQETMTGFYHGVDELRDRLARLEARLVRLEQRV